MDQAFTTITIIDHFSTFSLPMSSVYFRTSTNLTNLLETSLEFVLRRTLLVITYTLISSSCDQYVAFNVWYYGLYTLCLFLSRYGLTAFSVDDAYEFPRFSSKSDRRGQSMFILKTE